jgi:hypothetical protein
VDTVAFGSFRKSLWTELGGFNEGLHTNEDYDFNYRVRAAGGVVLLDRAEYSAYFARSTLRDLVKQYFRYGKWKARMIRLHPRSIKWRHLVAPMFVMSLIGLPLLGLWWRRRPGFSSPWKSLSISLYHFISRQRSRETKKGEWRSRCLYLWFFSAFTLRGALAFC